MTNDGQNNKITRTHSRPCRESLTTQQPTSQNTTRMAQSVSTTPSRASRQSKITDGSPQTSPSVDGDGFPLPLMEDSPPGSIRCPNAIDTNRQLQGVALKVSEDDRPHNTALAYEAKRREWEGFVSHVYPNELLAVLSKKESVYWFMFYQCFCEKKKRRCLRWGNGLNLPVHLWLETCRLEASWIPQKTLSGSLSSL